MASATTPNTRASLLAGLRTGGVRSTSQSLQVPHTAAPAGHFNIPRFASTSRQISTFPEEDEEEMDQLAEMTAQTLSFDSHLRQNIPMTAGVADSRRSTFQQQQLFLRQLAAQRAPLGQSNYPDQNELQAQMMQLELLRYQAAQVQQAQQYQADLIAAQAQAQRQPGPANPSVYAYQPMTAAPNVSSFDQRSNAVAQLRARVQQAEYFSALANEAPVPMPMTAAIGGKFATRGLNPQANTFMSRFNDQDVDSQSTFYNNQSNGLPSIPGRTAVISGGTSLGTPTTTSFPSTPPSKSDAAISWRRGSATRASDGSPPPSNKTRPSPLRFNDPEVTSVPKVTVDVYNVDEEGTGSSKTDSPTSGSSPSTPPSMYNSLTAETKKPYEGVGMGRPIANAGQGIRHVSLPLRQPKGPPSGADELGARNFASRIRRQAIGGLEALVIARESRDLAIEVQAY